MSRNIMIVDGAVNCAYDVFRTDEQGFRLIFPEPGQDIQFVEDLDWTGELDAAFRELWDNPVPKARVEGIHGTLYVGLEAKKSFFPNKRDSDLDFKGRAFSVAELLANR
jgi:hypothetical protein